MNCPECNSKTKIRETLKDESELVRRRKCQSCGKAFGTRERLDETSMVGTGRGSSPNSQKNIFKAHELLKVWK